MIPKKLEVRRNLEKSRLRLNTQIWFKAENYIDKLHDILIQKTANWPNVAISTALIREHAHGSSPLLKPCHPQNYDDKDFLKNEMEKLRGMVKEYNGQKDWHQDDWLRLFSSPLGINHLLVGLSVHFDISQFMKGGWGKVRRGFPFMPVIAEAQQGTWPRYLNTGKSKETIATFTNVFIDNPCYHWKDILVVNNGNELVVKALTEALEYLCSHESQVKILSLAKNCGLRWIGFDAQYIADNSEGYETGFRLYDFNGF